MKILVLQDWLRSGGTERQSILLANAFAAAGHASTLLTFRPGGALAASVAPDVSRATLQSFDVHLDWFAPGLLREIRRRAPDVVLCMGRMANCRAGKIQRAFPNLAVVATMRTGKALPGPFRRSLKVVRTTIANSEDSRAILVGRYGIPADRVDVIHNSLVFPPESSLTRNTALRRKLGAGPDTAVMLCVAMFRPEKNQRELIEIAAALPAALDWQLWLAGEGSAREACERLAREFHLDDRVKFLGFQRDPSPLFQAADIAVHSSRSESLSNFLIEAQAFGLPVVAYEAQGNAECFIEGKTGWTVPAGDRAGFVARLQPLLTDARIRATCASPARAFAREKFDATRQVQAYLDLFQRLVDSPSKK